MGAIVLLIAFLFWPHDKISKQSNPLDRKKTQIEVIVKRINIRKEPSVDSEDLGDVRIGEVYTVLSHEETDDYYWYHIKTKTDIEGYIASPKNKENVKLLSGYIDRISPVIKSKEKFLIFKEGKVTYDAIKCKDEYSKCTLSYDITDPDFIKFTGKDEDGNETTFSIKYYNIYKFESELEDNTSNVNAKFIKKNNDNIYTIKSNYSINKTIKNDNKSTSYTPIIDFYDEDFQPVDGVVVYYNSEIYGESCINKTDFTLKDNYQNNDLLKESSLCINYTFSNADNKIKYVSFGFSSDENYTNIDNALSSYYSKYYILDNE